MQDGDGIQPYQLKIWKKNRGKSFKNRRKLAKSGSLARFKKDKSLP